MILIAEDNIVVANYLKAHLKIKGYEVILAEDGFKAWTMLERQHGVVQLVVTDVSMPIMSGINLVERMRTHPEMKDTPVIFTSGVANSQIIAQAASLGKVHFLLKPLTMDALLPRIRELLPYAAPVLREKEQIRREFNLDDLQYRKLAGQFLSDIEAAIENLNVGLREYTIFKAINSLKFLQEGADLLGAIRLKNLLERMNKGEDIEVDAMLLELRALAEALGQRK